MTTPTIERDALLDWDEVFDCAAAAWCRSSTSHDMLRMCFQSRTQQNEVSVGWTANELMAFATGIARLYTHPSPPEGMVGGWIASKDQTPPPGVRVFWGDVDSNRVGYDSWAGDDYRWAPSHWMHIPEFPTPPTTSAGSGKGE